MTHGRDVPHVFGLVAREGVGAGKLYLGLLYVESASSCAMRAERWGGGGTTHQVEVILDKIALEGLERQRSVAHGQDERVVDEAVPDGGHIRSL